MNRLKIIINVIILFFFLFASNIISAEQTSWQNNYKQPDYFANSIKKTQDYQRKLITPESNLITGFLFEIKNHNLETNIKILETAYLNYFNLYKINIKNVISTANTSIFFLKKNSEDQNFYENFSKVISWFMLNRRDSSIAIRPIINNEEFIADRVIFFDKPQVITYDTTTEFLVPENAIVDGYHIHMDFLPGQQDKAKLLFNQFKDYISKQRLIYSDLDWYPENSNGPHLRAGWEIKFEKAGSQLMHDYGKSLVWLLLNHAEVPIYSHSKNWVFGENENRLISHLDHSWYSGATPKLNQKFFYSPENNNSGLYRWDKQLPNSKCVTKNESKLKQQEIIDFWFSVEVKPQWFRKQDATVSLLDKTITQKFAKDLFLLANGFYDSWLETPQGNLAYIILADQFPRNIYRGTPMIVAYDKLALKATKSIIESKDDTKLSYYERLFCYLPLVHSESVSDQKIAVEIFKKLRQEVPAKLTAEFNIHYQQALKHKVVIDKFGKFIHRDKNLYGIELTKEQIEFLKQHDVMF